MSTATVVLLAGRCHVIVQCTWSHCPQIYTQRGWRVFIGASLSTQTQLLVSLGCEGLSLVTCTTLCFLKNEHVPTVKWAGPVLPELPVKWFMVWARVRCPRMKWKFKSNSIYQHTHPEQTRPGRSSLLVLSLSNTNRRVDVDVEEEPLHPMSHPFPVIFSLSSSSSVNMSAWIDH